VVLRVVQAGLKSEKGSSLWIGLAAGVYGEDEEYDQREANSKDVPSHCKQMVWADLCLNKFDYMGVRCCPGVLFRRPEREQKRR
jgi:hypothetical protein